MQRRCRFDFKFILYLAVSVSVLSSAVPTQALAEDDVATETSSLNPASVPIQITSIRRGREAAVEPGNNAYIPAIWLRDTILVTVTDADRLLSEAPVDLYFNGARVPISEPLKVDDNQLEFKIDNIGEGSQKQFFARIFSEPWIYEKTVDVTVGNAIGEFKQAVPKPLTLRVVHLRHFVIWIVAMVILIVVLWILGRRTNLLRVWGDQQAGSGKPNRFSLGRFQLAFWFFLVVAAFSFIFLNVDKTMPVPMSVVVLMAISAATAIGTAMIEANEKASANEQLGRLRVELAADEAAIETLQKINSETDPDRLTRAITLARNQAQIEQKQQEIASLESAIYASPSRGFFRDLLSANRGYSLHRMQLVVWTLALGIVLISQVMKELIMPVFGDTLIALMGISCMTYLGFRLFEKK